MLARAWLAVLLAFGEQVGGIRATTLGGDAVALINSESGKYLDFRNYVQPYLDHFGVPYSVLDIATNAIGTNIGRYALVIIGHGQLDTNHLRLDSQSQVTLSAVVSNGTGLVNFDGDLAIGGSTPRYQFVQDVFGFGYSTNFSGSNVTFPATEAGSQLHYITSRHQTNETIALTAGMSLAGVTLPQSAAAVSSSSGHPFLIVRKCGQGCAVQWCSYDWMAVAVKGPMAGLDDLVWRSIVWAARKPFVMRGLPNFVTMRVDDAEGNFWWAHVANEAGLKPFIALFEQGNMETNTADLRSLVTNGNATASPHAFCASTFIYWNHSGNANWPDNVMSNNIYQATQWHASHGIPISKVVALHYSEIGPNAFPGMRDWGVEYVTLKNDPGTARTAPWLVAGPFRLYEPRQAGSPPLPLFYADFLNIPGHPELAGQFFNCVTEIRDDASCAEWCPDSNVSASIGRGTRQLKRAFDSMALATLFTHEWYIHPTGCVPGNQAITTNSWRSILQGITNNLAAYHPIYVTMDYACQYVRATRTAKILSSDYDSTSGEIRTALVGNSDVMLQIQVFTGHDSALTTSFGSVPPFSGVTNLVAARLAPALAAITSLPNKSVQLLLSGVPNLNYRLDASTDLVNWSALASFSNISGAAQFVDPDAINYTQRFYRAVWVP